MSADLDNTTITVRTFRDPEALANGAVEVFLAALEPAVRERGRFTVALAGGRTPRQLYERLAALPAGRVSWPVVEIFFGDERPVPPDHPDSNFRLAADSLLSHVPLPAANIHRLPGELLPATAADEYEREVRTAFAVAAPETPRFDLVLLGLGVDGHTASLFPGTRAVSESRRLVCANWVPKLGHHRLTLTFPVLNAARQVVFLVAGSDKARVVQEILAGPVPAPTHPAALVRSRNGRITWLLDAAAAAGLDAPRRYD